jgi:hypothetical protein
MVSAARTSVACEIAGISPAKLNGLIAGGDYICAPPTDAGASRIFEIDDIAVLYIFSKLIEQGFKANLAGRFANKARELASRYPNEDQPRFAWSINGNLSVISPEDDLSSGFQAGNITMFVVTFDLRNVRSMVRAQLDAKTRLLGND